jgi:endonuclease/exonuclease/phosphatase family metal-dependent hydrolase
VFSSRLRTFPAWLPTLRLDRIYASRDLSIGSAWTDRKAGAYSDHLPVIADVALAEWVHIPTPCVASRSL